LFIWKGKEEAAGSRRQARGRRGVGRGRGGGWVFNIENVY
jgi:hypothetical protein